MKEQTFRFKQFCIQQDQCAMKVGTDGVLLGAWADVSNAKNILDIGTGTGLIALMLAQRCQSSTSITALEIDPAAAAQARENTKRSPWAKQIEVIEADFRHHTFDSSFDLIVSNPPYFHDALACPDPQRQLARHTTTLTYEELLSRASSLLSPHGQLCLILPSEVSAGVEQKAQTKGLHTTRRVHILTQANKPPKRTLLSFSHRFSPIKESFLPIRNTPNEYSDLYIDLTKDYYTNLR